MSDMGKRWILHDRDGNPIYLTEERWHHILAGHPEMGEFEDHLDLM